MDPGGSTSWSSMTRTPKDSKPRKAVSDAALWRAVTKDVTPLGARRPVLPPAPEPAPEAGGDANEKTPASKPARPSRASPASTASARARAAAAARVLPAPPSRVPALPELAPGAVAGLDKRRAQRLRRGQLAIEGRLDLHGMTRAEAHGRLVAFIAEARDRGRRCVLVITGTGRRRDEAGVLRAAVPRWLNLPPCRERILAFATAQPNDGGDGALYVLLKKAGPRPKA